MNSAVAQPWWASEGWIDEVAAWIHENLARRGIAATGPIEQPHLRPWSTVLRIPTAGGAMFFKANTPLLASEPALVDLLNRLHPDQVLQPLAIEAERGWMLMVDGGTRLREVIRADRDLTHWERLLPRYAELQIELAGRLPELLVVGVPDRRLTRLPELIAQVIASPDKLRIGRTDGLSPADFQRLLDDAPTLADQCRQLAAAGIPQSVHHGDLHDGNIFAGEHGYQIFDWGDANVSHPFFSLRSAFVSVEVSLQLEEDAPQFDRLRDAYLEPWTRFAAPSDLRAIFAAAAHLSPLNSALGWNHALMAAGSQGAEYAHAIPSLFQEYLDSAAM